MDSRTGHIADLTEFTDERAEHTVPLSPVEYARLRAMPRAQRLRELREGRVRGSTRQQIGAAKQKEVQAVRKAQRQARRLARKVNRSRA